MYINAVVDERCVIISVRAEGAYMPMGKTKSRCAWEAVNLPASRCLHAMCPGYATGNKNLAEGECAGTDPSAAKRGVSS